VRNCPQANSFASKISFSFLPMSEVGIRVARFFLTQYTKTVKKRQTYQNITKWPWNIPDDNKIFQMTVKYTNMFLCKALQNLPKLGFLVWKYTIWQHWTRHQALFMNIHRAKFSCAGPLEKWYCFRKQKKNCLKTKAVVRIRVTRLGEFSPIEWLFTVDSVLKITEVVKILGPLCSTVPVM
jgi:hypothetical protein